MVADSYLAEAFDEVCADAKVPDLERLPLSAISDFKV